MVSRPTRESVLGTLVDRAACLPYAKPQVLRRGHRCDWDQTRQWLEVESIRTDIGDAASFIVGCLNSRGAQRGWSKAELALDPAGPWWAKTRDDFFELKSASRNWILERLEPTACLAAECLQAAAVDEKWEWLWSQPSFAAPGRNRPSITRPDLIAGLSETRCLVVDLKTTSASDLGSVVDDDLDEHFDVWTAHLKALGFVPTECWVLSVSTSDRRAEWIEF